MVQMIFLEVFYKDSSFILDPEKTSMVILVFISPFQHRTEEPYLLPLFMDSVMAVVTFSISAVLRNYESK
jgi:hypothetical protein